MFDIIKSQRGSLTTVILLAAAGLAVSLVALNYSNKVVSDRATVVKDIRAQFNNEIVTERLGQAIATTAILCAEDTGICEFNAKEDKQNNPIFVAEDFGFSDINPGTIMTLKASACLPKTNLDVCTQVIADVRLRLVDFKDETIDQLVGGSQATGDFDDFGILVSIATPLSGVTRGATNLFTTSSIIRRPRSFVRISPDPGICKQDCVISGAGSIRTPTCVGLQKPLGGTLEYRIRNDGPGFLYNFQVRRIFTPTGGDDADPIIVLSKEEFAEQLPEGLAPGLTKVFRDENLPCTVQTRETQSIDAGRVGEQETTLLSSTDESSGVEQSGTATYSFQPRTLEPDNALTIASGQGAVAATLITINTLVAPPAPVRRSGMN